MNNGNNINGTLQNLSTIDITVERLRERFSALYVQASQNTLEALNKLDALKDAKELKTKIIYSIVVVSFKILYIIYIYFIHELFVILIYIIHLMKC